VNTPRSTPFKNDASDGKNKTGIIFLRPYFDMEKMSMKFMRLPMSNCGCLKMKGTAKANMYTTES